MFRRALLPIIDLALVGVLFHSGQSQQPKSQQPKWPPSPHIAATEPRTPEAERRGFQVPPGFEVQLVAAEPALKKPINIAFDARGRLWVTTSTEYPFPAKNPNKTGDKVVILDDFGPDGRARTITTFAENLNIPIGVLPLGKGDRAIVYSIPNLWLLTDTDGDGKADRKEPLLTGYGHADTHGMTGEFQYGFDGWIYACHGYANTSVVMGRDGSKIKMTSGNTYRFKPDGTRVEYFSHGQVNPFGLCFDPLGNLYSADCHTQPIYQLLHGAWYPSFGRPHDGIGFGPEIMTHSHGSTAIGGITYYAADHFPPAFRDNIFVGNVVTNRVNRDSLQKFGSTLKAIEQPDFIVSDDPWFRPVDIKLGPDGALYIADFYTRIIGHYEVPLDHPGRDSAHGRIWRVVYKGKDGRNPLHAPRRDWTKASIAELVKDLAHPNLTVRLTATHQLVDRGGLEVVQAVRPLLQPERTAFERVHGLWVLERLQALEAPALAACIRAKDSLVRVHALKAVAERSQLQPEQWQLARQALTDPDAYVQRAAAEALGRHPDPNNLRPLLDCRYQVPAADTHLRHTVRMAIRDQLRPAESWNRVNAASWSDRDIRALADVLPSLRTPVTAQFLTTHLAVLVQDRNLLPEYVRHIARHGEVETRKQLVQFGQKHLAGDPLTQALLLKNIQLGTQERGGTLDPAVTVWATDLTGKLLGTRNLQEVLSGIEVASLLKIHSAEPKLVAILQDASRSVDQRRAAASALATIAPAIHVAQLGAILAGGSEPEPLRDAVAQALATTNLPQARDELVRNLASAPARLQVQIALALSSSQQGAGQLLDTVAAGKASARLLREPAVAQRLHQSGPPGLQQRLAKLTVGLPPVNTQLVDLIKRRSQGFARAQPNAALGLKVFEKNCAGCHMINNKGSKIAPQLDGLGVRGLDRILEDVLDPNRNVDQAFRATTLALKNGQFFTGLLLRQEGEVLVLADAEGKEKRFSQNEVDQRTVSQLSPMPANFGEQLSEPDLYNLMAFLLEQRVAAKGP